MTLFDRYIVVDWSASARPKQGRDSIWIADLSTKGGSRRIRYDNPSTRHEALRILMGRMGKGLAAGQRILAGFDFPFGYPRGTAARLGLSGSPWRALWDLLESEIEDAEDNRNNRFQVAARLNRQLTGEPFPFWGCPESQQSAMLRGRKLRPHAAHDLPERRYADELVSGAQPVWKLYTTGSVGSQILMGLPILSRLRRFLAPYGHVWPFETGLAPPAGLPTPCAILAEVYPSLWPFIVRRDEIKDKAQVRTAVRALHDSDVEGTLARFFHGPAGLSAAERTAIETEEAWILGAMA